MNNSLYKNYPGLEMYIIASAQKLTEGKHSLSFAFACEGGGGAGDIGTISLDSAKVAERGNPKKTHANMSDIAGSADVGVDLITLVSRKGSSLQLLVNHNDGSG